MAKDYNRKVRHSQIDINLLDPNIANPIQCSSSSYMRKIRIREKVRIRDPSVFTQLLLILNSLIAILYRITYISPSTYLTLPTDLYTRVSAFSAQLCFVSNLHITFPSFIQQSLHLNILNLNPYPYPCGIKTREKFITRLILNFALGRRASQDRGF